MSQLRVKTEAPRPGSAGAWVLACRPKTLSAAAVPVLIGSACALRLGGLRPGPAAAALCGALLLQIGANLANDAFDYEKGADTAARLGPLRTAQAGLLSPRQLRVGTALAFALATLCGLYLASVAGPVIIAIGVASIVAGLAYTAGPYPLGYHGLGDLFVFLFFGLVAVWGTALTQLGAVPGLALAAALPVGALATAILVVNNVRDADTDRVAGKRTLVVRLGRRAGLVEYGALLALAYGVPALLVLRGALSSWGLLPLLTAPLGLGLLRGIVTLRGAPLNGVLHGTAKLLLLHGALFAAGIALP